MLESDSLTIFNFTCDKCGKKQTVVGKSIDKLKDIHFTINTETKECLCFKCAKLELPKKPYYVKQSKFDDPKYDEGVYPIAEFVDHIKNERTKDMIKMRLNDSTLVEIGNKYGVSRENVRQVTTRMFKKIVAEEDSFEALYWFEKYGFLTKENFKEVFGLPEQTYFYYKCKYDRDMFTTKDNLFSDPKLTEELRTKFDDIFIYSKDKKNEKWREKALLSYAYVFEGNPWGQLTALDITREYSEKRKTWLYKAICQCSCGNYAIVSINMLPRTKSCGCAKKNIRDWITSPSKRPTKPCKCVETGIIYESITKASKETGINSGSIAQCCKNPTNTVHGYHWEYADPKYGRNYYECENTRKVRCIETGEVFNSINEARKKYPSVANILYRTIKSTNGYHFEFVEE